MILIAQFTGPWIHQQLIRTWYDSKNTTSSGTWLAKMIAK